ncbi:MAG: hypothetical protein WC683_06250 [bacterium]
MPAAAHAFTIGGRAFRLTEPLKLRASLKGAAIVAEVILPGFVGVAAMRELDPAKIRSALAGCSRLDELIDMFSQICEVQQEQVWLPLSTLIDHVFERRLTLALAWLLECITWQWGDFLAADGQALLEAKASVLISQLAPTGASGE